MKIMSASSVDFLRQKIGEHLDLYRNGSFEGLFDEIEVDITLDYERLQDIEHSVKDDLKDVENCLILHDAASDVSPYAARDERLWVHLCHDALLEYSRSRWPIPDDDAKAITWIGDHFFANEKRKLESRNSVSRLYWISHVAAKASSMPIKDVLELILEETDIDGTSGMSPLSISMFGSTATGAARNGDSLNGGFRLARTPPSTACPNPRFRRQFQRLLLPSWCCRRYFVHEK